MESDVVHPLYALVCPCLPLSESLLTTVTHKCGAGVMHYALCKIWAVSLCPELGTVVK
jgi:hypothetical protein